MAAHPEWRGIVEADAETAAALAEEAAVLLEAEGVAVDYTYLPEETE